ncbi:hypothetical protein [Limnohabitans sp. T6-5]|uniref:hypothetical protein n=1 Tax=Limnohabitans sp. T6-5 TaxID=1100724 RepID=UPI0011B29BF9|nr:hypothetical protein [Limnohabitans sp. T6-5]
MSEATARPGLNGAWLAHAGEVAQWTVLLLGWLWLGEQGMRLGWSVASGVLAVAVWWAARIVCRGSGWAFQSASSVMGACGLLTACGVWLPELLARPAAAHAGLLVLAVVWGLWSALIETRTQVSTFQMGRVAWHPLVAAGLVSGAWRMPGSDTAAPWGVSLLLALCAALVYVRDRHRNGRASACRGQRAGLQTWLAPSAMGLMMGTLWLGNVWCAGLGWSTEQMVAVHLALMAGLPTLIGLVLRGASRFSESSEPLSSDQLTHASLGLLCLGAIMGLGNSAASSVLAMLLPSLGWAVHCNRHRSPVGGALMRSYATRGMALLMGPVLLVGVGLASPLQGPVAVQLALAVLGALAAWQASALWWRTHTRWRQSALLAIQR